MAAWIKMSLDMELGLGPGDFVLDGDPAPLPKRGRITITITSELLQQRLNGKQMKSFPVIIRPHRSIT